MLNTCAVTSYGPVHLPKASVEQLFSCYCPFNKLIRHQILQCLHVPLADRQSVFDQYYCSFHFIIQLFLFPVHAKSVWGRPGPIHDTILLQNVTILQRCGNHSFRPHTCTPLPPLHTRERRVGGQNKPVGRTMTMIACITHAEFVVLGSNWAISTTILRS